MTKRLLLLILLFSSIQILSQNILNETTINTYIPYIFDKEAVWIDYDKDEDLDLSVIGVTPSLTRAQYLIKNENGAFNEIVFSCSVSNQSNFKWIDYNQDGKLDLVAAVEYGTFGVFINEGNDTFSQKNINIDYSIIWVSDWVDYDNDGDMDFMLSGRENGDHVIIYRNDGNDLFIKAWTFPYQNASQFDWGDFNRDGYKDLLMISYTDNPWQTAFSLYLNNGNSTFTEKNLDSFSSDTWFCRWLDYNNDGFQDILLSGRLEDNDIKLYKNENGSGSFTLQDTAVYSIILNDLKTGDLNNDGNTDIILTGTENRLAKVLFNQDGTEFNDSGIDFPETVRGQTALGDYDNDDDLDLALTSETSGGDTTGSFVKIYTNTITSENNPPASPGNLSATVVKDKVIFSWNAPLDDNTTSDALTYNLQVGSTPGSGDILTAHSISPGGSRIKADMGNALYATSFTIKNLINGKYYWSIQAIDQVYKGSSFPAERSFVISQSENQQFTDINASIQGVVYSDAAWADYDIDGDLDFIISGWNHWIFPVFENSRIYRNDNGFFTDINADLINVTYSAVALGDYNNDGLPDLAISGYDSNEVIRTDIYKNLGNNQFENINAGIMGLIKASLAWGDCDNDGDLDLIASGYIDFSSQGANILYLNQGHDTFISSDIDIIIPGKAAWADFDKDGDLDLSVGIKLYRNNGDNLFEDTGFSFFEPAPWPQKGPLIWGDYDSDGDPDILSGLTTYRNSNGSFSKQMTFNDIGDFGTERSVFADMDNDGDLDLLLSGHINGTSNPAFRYLKNNGSGTFANTELNIPGAMFGGLAAGDYDKDGDLDILMNGNPGSLGTTKIYRNDGVPPNQKPLPPSNIQATIGEGTVFLNWPKSSDNETASDGLTYNILIGTDAASTNIKSPMAAIPNGYRYVPEPGNVSQVTQWPFHAKKSGKYYYSVQAIDNSYTGSSFSEKKEFIIPNTPPSAVSLASPFDNDTLEYSDIIFKWSSSRDIFSDTLGYTLKIFSAENDTMIISLKDTAYNFSGSGWIVPGLEYKWHVLSNDEEFSVSSVDTFTFVKRKLNAGTLTDSMFAFISNVNDSAVFKDRNGKIIMKMFWEPGAVLGASDTLRIGIKSTPVVPPYSGGGNYSLLNPVIVEPKFLNSIDVIWDKVKIRLYPDTTLFKVHQLGNHLKVYRVDENLSALSEMYIDRVNYDENWVEFNFFNLKKNNSFIVTADNILTGDITSGMFSEEITNHILIPVGEKAELHEGVHFRSAQGWGIEVKGTLICNGTANSPVDLSTLIINGTQPSDSDIYNNYAQIYLKNAICSSLSLYASKAYAEDSRIGGIYASDYSIFNAKRIITHTIMGSQSIITMDSSQVDSNGSCNGSYSLMDIQNTNFNHFIGSEYGYSLVHLKNNLINFAGLSGAIQSHDSFVLLEDNTIHYNGNEDDRNRSYGISMINGNYAVINNNVITGFWNGIWAGSYNKVLIYNNTFANNERGIILSATPDTVGIFNNIFYNQTYAIKLDYSSFGGGTNVSYINNNLWKERNPGSADAYILNADQNSLVIGDSISFNTDPLFGDTINFYLIKDSPAIDMGLIKIPAFKYSHTIFDSTIAIGDFIDIDNFNGKAPDLGAREFTGTVYVAFADIPKKFYLYQNYPNPFNPSTTIKYTLPEAAFVKLKVYNSLGELVRTLVNETKNAGYYEISFDASSLSSGMYIYKLEAGSFVSASKMILLK